MKFQELGLRPALLDAVDELGYVEPTPIQAQAIPLILEGRDIIGSAQTGTGKTAAFSLPILSRLAAPERSPRCLVLEPTRELAQQTYDNFLKFARFTKLRAGIIYGGVGYGAQRECLRRGVDILVATPGRLLDHMGEGAVRMDRIEFVVLDEADRMLDMGFLPDVKRILMRCPKERQTLLFSATIPPAIESLSSWALVKPAKIEIGARRSPADTIRHVLYPVALAQKNDLLLSLLEKVPWESIILFCRTRRSADTVASFLKRHKHKAAVIHSDRTQRERQQALEGFKTGHFQILVATDVAARGLDIADVSHVINYEVPEHPEDYVHRIGRTGRAQATGDAFTLMTAGEAPAVHAIERFISRKVERVRLEGFNYQYSALFDEERLGSLADRKTRGVRLGKGYFFGPARRRR
ncbi:MAG: DEAD/DEAH box helicase [Verrucomicrobiota bacterium]